MVELTEEQKNIPICDTNILINFGLVDFIDRFIKYYKKIFISDFVKDELLNKIPIDSTYSFLRKNIDNDFEIINKNKYFNEDEILMMNHILNQYELTHDSLINNTMGKNIGEFVSAIYAANLGIKVFITNDIIFINEYKNESIFKNLLFKNMTQILDKIVGKDERKKIRKEIIENNKEMVKSLESESLLKKLNQLKEKFA